MRIVEVTGGLGNQMFQYSFGQYLKHRFPEDTIKYDLDYFGAENAIREYELKDAFGIDANVALRDEIRSLRGYSPYDNKLQKLINKISKKPDREPRVFTEDLDAAFDEGNIASEDGTYYSGYWQCEGYFKDFRPEIIDGFKPDLKDTSDSFKAILKDISDSNSVSVHVRLDDYLDEDNFRIYGDICTRQYYEGAIQYLKEMNEDHRFFLFTTDIENAKKVLPENISFIPVEYEGQKDYLDMYLMTRCRHNIIANSTFSWWGAWLNETPGKKVICPGKWFNNHETFNQYCDGWIKI